ncbi:MAG: hypothetical protein HFH65_04855 [Lachnospiraceae bacterium]|nr:hypothetical protein [Lachnospiraceae bacterium]
MVSEKEAVMLKCRICSCICDPADLRGGICDDCREEAEQEDTRQETLDRLLKSEYKQMRLKELVHGGML